MRKLSSVIGTLTILVGLQLGGQGLAQAQQTAAMLGVEAGDAPVEMAAKLGEALRVQIQQSSKYKLVSGKAIEEIKLVFGCVEESPTCMATAGRSMQAEKILWGALRANGAGFRFTIKMVDVAKARVEQQVSDDIRDKKLSAAQAAELVNRLTKSFLGGSSVGEVNITSNVSGAQIKEGVQLLGITDEREPTVLRDMTEGQHLLKIEKEGYLPWEQQVSVRSGDKTQVNAQLVPESDVPLADTSAKPAGSSNSPWRIAFWSGLAVTAGFAAGLTWSALSVRGIEQERDDALLPYVPTTAGQQTPYDVNDVCAARSGWDPPASIKDVCDRGQSRALLTNVLIALTSVSAITTGYFYYKGYMSTESSTDAVASAKQKTPQVARLKWQLSPALGVRDAFLKFALTF